MTKALLFLSSVKRSHGGVLWLFHILALIYGKWRLHKKRDINGTQEKSLPGVSILKPLCCEDDPHLFQNLETFFKLDYPKYEILFCIQDMDDTKLRMYVESLINKFPRIDCSVFYGGEEVGVNPKINNMQPGYRASKHELIMVSDSGIKMKEDTLKDMVSFMTDRVGLVHQMPFSCDKSGFSSTLEKVFFGTSHARIYLVANMFGINCSTGMSTLMRKDVLDDPGKIRGTLLFLPFKSVLLDGQNSAQPWFRQLLYFEPISECLCLGLLASWAVFYLWKVDPILFFAFHILLWFIMDWTLLCVVQNDSLPFNKLEFLLVWVYREISAPCLFIAAQLNPWIKWRDKYFKTTLGRRCRSPLYESSLVILHLFIFYIRAH
ncbi:UGCG [Lepeophtheirus salmonis]|uniref:ceramide glucosyltransferase n=1 Tax=Lepeophtheirus salmonis TaxID=72036 RepID=A0A7R8H2K4_LEPSM|nr:UGCG [Lepeophtheirus salmonis]CAF2829611.1 UGCG [Lepeophtheirus salmonis]